MSINGRLMPNANYLKKELGFSNDTIKENSKVLTMSNYLLKSKAECLMEEWGFDKTEIKRVPHVLDGSLNYRIKPRLAFLKHRGAEISSPLIKDIADPDDTFCARYGAGTEEYKSFRTIYLASQKEARSFFQSRTVRQPEPGFRGIPA